MKPYYSEAGIEIYHGDCREILPSLPKVDLVLTDPPYGIDFTQRTTGLKIVGDDQIFDASNILDMGLPTIIWGENYIPDLPRGGRLIWVKRAVEQAAPKTYSDAEIAWTNTTNLVRAFRHISDGCIREGAEHGIVRMHPSQKPIALMKWCLSFAPSAQTILDPFMGSGTTLRAAKDLGRKAIGIEIEEKYCEIAANRLRQEVLKFEAVA